jgi:hypothetical protein
LPVTAAEVAMFLDYETTQPKVRVIALSPHNCNAHLRVLTSQRKRGTAETIPNYTVGKQVISQRINALENWRLNHHHYKDNHEAQISLRFDNRIQQIESAAKHKEPKRTASSQVLKAAGTSYGWHFLSLPVNTSHLLHDRYIPTPKWNSPPLHSGA